MIQTHDIFYTCFSSSFFWALSVHSSPFGIAATIRTHREIQCLPYAECFYFVVKSSTDRGVALLLVGAGVLDDLELGLVETHQTQVEAGEETGLQVRDGQTWGGESGRSPCRGGPQ